MNPRLDLCACYNSSLPFENWLGCWVEIDLGFTKNSGNASFAYEAYFAYSVDCTTSSSCLKDYWRSCLLCLGS